MVVVSVSIGKTGGRGVKGQTSRSGSGISGFEGVVKCLYTVVCQNLVSPVNLQMVTAEVRLSELKS